MSDKEEETGEDDKETEDKEEGEEGEDEEEDENDAEEGNLQGNVSKNKMTKEQLLNNKYVERRKGAESF